MNREELDAVNLVGSLEGGIWDYGCTPPRLVVAPGATDPRYFNLLRGASIAHVALKTVETTLEQLAQMCEQTGLDAFVPAVMEAGTSVTIARRIACEGIEAVSAERNRERG